MQGREAWREETGREGGETEEEGERRFNNLRLWEVGEGGREENALNDDNRRKEARSKGGTGLDRDIVLPGDQHICGKSA